MSDPTTDVSLTVKNFLNRKRLKKTPAAIQYGVEKEPEAKLFYTKIAEKEHSKFVFEEPGFLVSTKQPWLGASLDGITKCKC